VEASAEPTLHGTPGPGCSRTAVSASRDHVWGNQLLAGARIVSTAKAKRLMSLDPPQELRKLQRAGRALAAVGRRAGLSPAPGRTAA